MATGVYTVVDLLRRPGYAVPLLVNLTGSVWFFLLIGKAGRCFSHWRGGFCGRSFAEDVRSGNRIESYGADYEFVGVSVYGVGRVVG